MISLSYRFAGGLLAALALCSSCKKEDAELVDRTLTIAAFEGLEVRVGANVELSEGPTQKVEVRGTADFINRLRTTVDNGTWKADVDGTVRDQSRATIRVTLPRLRRLVMAGSGTVRGLTAFTGPALDVTHSGSGAVLLTTAATDVAVSLSGSGPVELAGTTVNQVVSLSGSGNYRGFGLNCAHTQATVPGSGDAQVWATATLRATIPGSGHVRYKGRPAITASTPGSGRVIDGN